MSGTPLIAGCFYIARDTTLVPMVRLKDFTLYAICFPCIRSRAQILGHIGKDIHKQKMNE